jgi:hypothetical protein
MKRKKERANVKRKKKKENDFSPYFENPEKSFLISLYKKSAPR